MKRIVSPKVIEKTIDILVTIDDFKQFEDLAAAKKCCSSSILKVERHLGGLV